MPSVNKTIMNYSTTFTY